MSAMTYNSESGMKHKTTFFLKGQFNFRCNTIKSIAINSHYHFDLNLAVSVKAMCNQDQSKVTECDCKGDTNEIRTAKYKDVCWKRMLCVLENCGFKATNTLVESFQKIYFISVDIGSYKPRIKLFVDFLLIYWTQRIATEQRLMNIACVIIKN